MTTVDFDAFADEFARVYNAGRLDIKQFYADEVIWIEMPGGRNGGRDDFFSALDAVEEVLSDAQITEILRTYSNGNLGILENRWTATRRDGQGALNALQSWVWEFDDAGRITMQRDYFMPIPEEPMGYE